MVAIAGFNKEQIIFAVRQMYSAVATAPASGFHFPTGPSALRFVGYPPEPLEGIPDAATESFAGVGYPFRAGVIRTGDHVLDIGSGSGTDALIAARLAGPRGRVYALDITVAMLAKVCRNAASTGTTNVVVLEGTAEGIPLADASIDVVTSNGVLNLVPDKRRATAEIFRVLRPGGRVQIADIVIARPVGADQRRDPALWAECVVGATVEEDYLDLFRRAGFADLAVLRSYDYFAGSASEETRRIAAAFGAHAVEISMSRPTTPQPALAGLAARLNPLPLLRRARQRGVLGIAMATASLLACYGTLAVLAALAMFGIALPIDSAAWAAVIAGLALVAPIGVALNRRWHGARGPLLLAITGAAMVLYVLLVAYDWRIEALGFLALLGGAGWDLWLYRRSAAC
jgi:ubiquinone/menaquinone biosynthesis C-methylase UbiE